MDKEIIIAINEVSLGKGWNGEDGFEVITTQQAIKLLIDNGQDCCEHWGYFWCNDKPEDFIGAELLSVELTDTALNQAVMQQNDLDPNAKYFEGGVMFVNLKTDRGVLQFVAYNEHNGYYGHDARVECKQLSERTTL